MEEPKLKDFEQALRGRISGEVSFDDVTRGLYATDASIYQITPVAVVLPRDEADVRAALKTAVDYSVNVLPRGGGTSLGGQAVGPSMVIDFSKYMNNILELNVKDRWVRVQPGIILDELNTELARHGLLFAPDPATSSRATIGGMMGNNSSGTRSIIYGRMCDHVLAGKVLLSDGTTLELEELSLSEYDHRAKSDGPDAREAEILSGFKKIIETNSSEIEKRFPKVMRRVNGYNLDSFINTDRWNLTNLMVGSEGTLGIFLEAKLNLEPLPKSKALCTVHFAELLEAIRTVAVILEHKPSAVEIMDADVVVRARKNLSVAPLCGFIQGDPQAILVVEFFGETPKDTEQKCRALAADLQEQKLGYAWPVITQPAEQAKVWGVRKNGLGLMLGIKGDRKPLPFIEDACVPIEVLPEYVDRILAFCKERGVRVAMYAHASVGTIHIRPILNLKDSEDIDNMKAIAEFAFGLVKSYGGAWSGEHGDGRVRSPFLERFFGTQIYKAFREIKGLFDPAGLMNPGLIIEPNAMEQDLRYGTMYKTPTEPTEYHYREDGSFAAAVEMCTGVGACRQKLDGTMCPSYRATLDEEHSTRGRANALRLAMTGQLGPDAMTSRRLFEVMDLCLSCKSCKSECPSNVDVARLKSEFLQKHHDAHGPGLRERIIAGSTEMAGVLAGRKAPIINFVQNTWFFRKVLELVAGFDSRRKLPEYATVPFPKWFSRRSQSNGRLTKKVVLFDDTYMDYHQTNVGVSAVELLESCGYEVILANAGCCQRPKISHGFLRDARTKGEKTLLNLDKYIQQDLKVVVCEPGCCSALTDDLPDLINDEQLGQRIKENVMMIDEFLAQEVREGNLNCEFRSPFSRILIHGHCHQKSLYGTDAMKQLLDSVPGICVSEIDSGCCGMAGSFGYEKEHHQLSMQIGEDRLFPAVRSRQAGTAVVACGFSCRHQLADGTGVKALHWVESIRGTGVSD
ncbi:MAG: FAD-binding and (Fe-S)-binding domain-containing protein [Planctomycetota bacterium]|jgi:FAD/FMN-containing dehydrogenase/Fe-S oxidoreductase